MMTTTFDTHAAVKQLRTPGIDDAQAETLVDVISHATGERVAKADLEPLATKEMLRAEVAGVRTEIANLEARLYRHLWAMAAGIVGATVALLKLFP